MKTYNIMIDNKDLYRLIAHYGTHGDDNPAGTAIDMMENDLPTVLSYKGEGLAPFPLYLVLAYIDGKARWSSCDNEEKKDYFAGTIARLRQLAEGYWSCI